MMIVQVGGLICHGQGHAAKTSIAQVHDRIHVDSGIIGFVVQSST